MDVLISIINNNENFITTINYKPGIVYRSVFEERNIIVS